MSGDRQAFLAARELCEQPVGLMAGYQDSAEKNAEAMRGGYYHTGDTGGAQEFREEDQDPRGEP